MMSSSMKHPHTSPEAGFAALIIGIILVLILGLLTIGFAQLVRHEQSSALDKQLSSQAYYAAESGVNDAYHAIQGYLKTGQVPPARTSCAGNPPSDYPTLDS